MKLKDFEILRRNRVWYFTALITLIRSIELWIQISHDSCNAVLLIILKFEDCMTYRSFMILSFLPLAFGSSVSCTHKVTSYSKAYIHMISSAGIFFFHNYYTAGFFSTFTFQLKYYLPKKSFLSMLVNVGLPTVVVVGILRWPTITYNFALSTVFEYAWVLWICWDITVIVMLCYLAQGSIQM